MNKSAPGPTYCVDSSSFMDWQARYYPLDVFSGVADQVEALISMERFLAPSMVREELEKVGTEGLIQWLEDREGIFIATGEVLAGAQAVQNQFAGLRDPKAEYEEADAYVIALAQLRSDGIVVTQETPAAEKRNPKRTHFIPDVCRELGVPCISFLGLMRREGWRF
jgi:Domain of unknown function (DUF4411)